MLAVAESATEIEVPMEEVEGPRYLIGGEAEQPDEEYVPYPFADERARQERTIRELRSRTFRMEKSKGEAETEAIANMQADLDELKAQVSAVQRGTGREATHASMNPTGTVTASQASKPRREAAGASARKGSQHDDAMDGSAVRSEPAPAAAVEEDAATKAARAAKAAQRAAARRAKALADATAKAEAAQAAAAAAAAEAASAKADPEAARKAAAERLRLRKERERREAEAAEAAEASRAAAARGNEGEALRLAAERLRVEKEKKDEALVAARVSAMSRAQLQREAEDLVSSLMAQHQAEANEVREAEEMHEREAERLYAEADGRAVRQTEAQLANLLKEVREVEAMQLPADSTGGGPVSRKKSVLRRGSTGSVDPDGLAFRGVESTPTRRGDSPEGSHCSSRGGFDEVSVSNPGLGEERSRGDATAPPAGEAAEADALMAPVMEQLSKLESTWEEWASNDGTSSAAAVQIRNWACWQEKSGLGATLGSLRAPSASVGSAVADSIALLDRALSLPYEPWQKLAKRVKPWQAKPGSSAAVNLEALRSYRQTQLELIAARIRLPDRPKLPPVPAQIAAAQRTRDDAGGAWRRTPSKHGQSNRLQRSETTGSIRVQSSGQGGLGLPAKPQHVRQRSGSNLSAGACALELAGGWNSSRLAADACAWSSGASAPGLSVRRAESRSRERGESGRSEGGRSGDTERTGSGGTRYGGRRRTQSGSAPAELNPDAAGKVPPALTETRGKQAHVLAANEAARSREVATAVFWSARDAR